MFWKKKDKLTDALRGAIRPPMGGINAPKAEFRGASTERAVDLRKFCAPVIDQGALRSCAACATVAGMEILAAKQGRADVRLSPLFLYYNARKLTGNTGKDTGLMSMHAPAAVLLNGVCSEQAWPYSEDALKKEPSEEAYAQARNFDATQYARIETRDAMMQSLSNGIPVVFGSGFPKNYYAKAFADPRGLMPEPGALDEAGDITSHAMLAVGYDDQEKWVLVRNSMGATRGDGGYLRIPYKMFDSLVWTNDMWAIGNLENLGSVTLRGMSPREAAGDVQANASSQMDAALSDMRKSYGDEMEKATEQAKTSIRDRLRAQEDALEKNRNRGGGGDQGGGGGGQ